MRLERFAEALLRRAEQLVGAQGPTPEQRAQAQGLVTDYLRAWLAAVLADEPEPPPPPGHEQAVQQCGGWDLTRLQDDELAALEVLATPGGTVAAAREARDAVIGKRRERELRRRKQLERRLAAWAKSLLQILRPDPAHQNQADVIPIEARLRERSS